MKANPVRLSGEGTFPESSISKGNIVVGPHTSARRDPAGPRGSLD